MSQALKDKRRIKYLTTFLMLITTTCWSLPNDHTQVANLKADSADIDYQKGISKYYGHVHFNQGSTQIAADYGMTKTNKKHELIEAVAKSTSKKLALYQTKPKPDQEIVYAQARTIIWHPQQNKVLLIGDASVKQGRNSYKAPHIEYDTANQHVISQASKHGKTVIMVYPEKRSS